MSTSTLTGFVKPVRTKNERIHALSMKPLQFVPGDSEEEDATSACFVDYQSKEHLLPCTLQAARRIQGGKPRNPKQYNGLDAKLNREFIIHIADVKGVRTVVGVDQFPKRDATRRFQANGEQPTDDVVMQISPVSGDIDVIETPPSLSQAALMRMLKTIDGVKSLDVGDAVNPGYVVVECTGGRVRLETQ